MTPLQSTLFEWDLTELYKNVTGALAVVLAVHSTDGVITGMGAMLLFLFVFCIPLSVAEYLSIRSGDS